MNEELDAILENLDKYLNELFSKLDINLPEIQKDIYDRLTQFTSKLSLSKGNIVASVENLKLLNGFKKELGDMLEDSDAMDNVVSDFLAGIKQSTEFINDYFALMLVNFSENPTLIKAIQQITINDTIQLLKGDGFLVNILEPIRLILQQNITTAASYKDLQKEISAFLDNKAQRYVKQIVNDSILGYERSYIMNIAQDLDMQYYFYQGTKIETTRPFCNSRVGKAYTKNEVEEWATKEWNGKRIGTNKSNIFFYAGGYNCRHRILPITKEIYTTINNNQ